MTAHQLAKLLLAGPDLPVYRASYEMWGDSPEDRAELVEGVQVTEVCPVPGERGMAYNKEWPANLDKSKRRVVYLP
jgi:hypothetical protein